jgi:hypothetical protein
VAPNALLGFALFGALTLAGCSGSGQQEEATPAQTGLAAPANHDDMASAQSTLAASTTLTGDEPDSAKTQPKSVPAPSADSIARMGDAEAAMADSVQRAREIEVLRETFAYGGGTRDPFNSLLNIDKNGPEVADCDLVGVYQDLRTPSNSVVVLREKVSAKRHKLRVGDQLSRARLVQIRPRDAVFMIHDFGFERQETLSLRKQEVETP